jgi:hypothetical protein
MSRDSFGTNSTDIDDLIASLDRVDNPSNQLKIAGNTVVRLFEAQLSIGKHDAPRLTEHREKLRNFFNSRRENHDISLPEQLKPYGEAFRIPDDFNFEATENDLWDSHLCAKTGALRRLIKNRKAQARPEFEIEPGETEQDKQFKNQLREEYRRRERQGFEEFVEIISCTEEMLASLVEFFNFYARRNGQLDFTGLASLLSNCLWKLSDDGEIEKFEAELDRMIAEAQREVNPPE